MKYKSEIIHEILEQRGHEKSSLHYQSECVETWVDEAKGGYPKLCDYESEWLNYINENPIGEFPYETVTTNNTATVNNVVPFAYKSAILTGNTLVNIFDATLPTQIKNTHDITLSYQVNANETYTFIVEAESTSEKYQGGFITTNGAGNGWNSSVDNGISKFTITTSEATNKVRFSAHGASNTVQIKKCMIIKGDYSNQDIPFFTGMQSVKMPVLTTTGKNLFSGIHTQTTDLHGRYYVGNDTYTLSLSDKDTTIDLTGIGIGNSIPNSVNWLINNGEVYGNSRTFTNSHIVYYPNSEEALNKLKQRFNIQIEKGSVATPYEPYKSNILTVNEDVELRGIGDVQDTLDCLTGEVTERISEIILDGSDDENIIQRDDIQLTDKISFQINNLFGFNAYYEMTMVCDKFKVYYEQADEELIRPINGRDMVVINISTSKCNDLDSFKVWLSQNPVTVQYHLKTKSIKTVDLTVVNQDGEPLSKFKPIEGTMHIEVSGTPINPTAVLEVPVEAIAQNLNSFIEEE